ncbi:rRNA-processing protein utp23 [Trametes pubescens]|uniref:U three protein 23 n=1 Tax=Trametes pubescens TaxID=154538 RepID=A0A1M2VWB6_TRAPU|nr:rRNA-processing protein utp23 [Trametes pubescens]
MCTEAVSHKIELLKQLGVVLQGAIKPMITQCCIHEIYLQGKDAQPVVDLAKEFERRKCNHREAIPGDECVASVVGETNKHRYVIATQSQELRQKLRSIPGVPVVHMNRSVMILEPPSDATLRVKALAEEKALHPSAPEAATLPTTAPEERPKKKKGPKGPNPLSVKRKKTESSATAPAKKGGNGANANTGDKREREDDAEADAPASQPDTIGHKRKRRRKHAAGKGEQGEQGAAHGDSD